MRIGIVGGIFGTPDRYRATVQATPETVLADELERRGHDVVRLPHRTGLDLRGLDLVHVHHLSWGAVAAATHPARAPLVFTPHWLRYRSWARRSAARYVIRRTDGLVALSETEARWQRGAYGLRSGRQAVIPNGIRDDSFPYSAPSAPGDGPWRLLYVGQLARFKGVDNLLRAVAAVSRSHDVQVDLAYQTRMEEGELRRLAAELRLEHVRFLGARDPDELRELYAESHLFVLPSRSGEALPSVISEAMLVGRPVVATDVAGVREQLAGFGVIVPPDDVGALAAGIRRALEDYPAQAARAPEMSQAARRAFSVSAMADAHEALYESVLGAGSERPIRHRPSRRPGTGLGRLAALGAGRARARRRGGSAAGAEVP